MTNNVFFDKKSKNNNKIKTLAGAEDWTPDLLHPKRMRYHSTTESTKSKDSSQAI